MNGASSAVARNRLWGQLWGEESSSVSQTSEADAKHVALLKVLEWAIQESNL